MKTFQMNRPDLIPGTVKRGTFGAFEQFLEGHMPNTTQHNTTQHNTTQHNTTQHNTTQHMTVPEMSSDSCKSFNHKLVCLNTSLYIMTGILKVLIQSQYQDSSSGSLDFIFDIKTQDLRLFVPRIDIKIHISKALISVSI